MNKLHFAYPVCLTDGGNGQVRITCRDLPELSLSLPCAEGLLNHLEAAEAALDAMVNEYISQGRPLPSPSLRE